MESRLFDHEKLHAYQEALHFVTWVDGIIERLPARFAARDQLDRASTSILLNIAEGKTILRRVVSLVAGLIAHFSSATNEDPAPYDSIELVEKENE
jgi:23S rRNA-intervening sequence protein